VMDIMIHDIDIVLNLIKSKVIKTHVIGASVFSEKDDLVSAQLEFENGCVANIVASRVSHNKLRKLFALFLGITAIKMFTDVI